MTGTEIGDNVIIASGCVIRGKVEDRVIVAGNPGKGIGKVDDWIINNSKKIRTILIILYINKPLLNYVL